MRMLRRAFWLLCFLLLAPGCRAAPGAAQEQALRQEFHNFVYEGRKAPPIRATVLLTHQAEGRKVERVRFETEPGEQVVAAIARPEKGEGRLPAVIVQHYLGGSKDEIIIQALVWQLAGRGFLLNAALPWALAQFGQSEHT